jgi:AraC-like DNA-binding protein
MPVSVGSTTYTASTGPDFDMHYFLELGIALVGRVRRHWRSWETVAEVGDVWYCGVLEPHGWETIDLPCEHMVVTLLPSVLIATGLPVEPASDLLAPFRSPPELRPRVQPKDRPHVLAITREIAAAASLQPRERQVLMRLLVLELLVLLQKDWDAAESPPGLSATSQVGSAVELVLHSHGLVTVEQAARAAGMSRRTFQRAFQGLVGMPFARYARRHRLAQAAQQLWRTDDAVETVAAAWGFADASHLCRLFQHYYRCSPAEYRRREHPSLTWPTFSDDASPASGDSVSGSSRGGD